MFQKLSASEKVFGEEGGGSIKTFIRKILSHSAEKVAVGPIRESVIAGDEKFYASEGYVTIFCWKLFVSQHRNVSQRNPSMLCIREFSVAKKIWIRGRGKYQDVLSKNFVSQCRKIRRGAH